MVSVKMTPDIREYSPKTFIFFTTRQALSLGGAGLLGFLLFAVTSFLPIPVRFIITLPGFFAGIMVGWYKPYGMPFEALLVHIIKNRIGVPRTRYYATVNTFRGLAGEPEPAQKKKKMTRKEKKALDEIYEKYGVIS